MPLALRVAAVAAVCAGFMWAVNSEDGWIQTAALIGFAVLVTVVLLSSASAREGVAGAIPPLSWVAGAGFHRRGRAVALTVAGSVGAIAVAEAVERATRPQGTLAAHVERLVPRLAELPPIRAAEALERGFPAEDQRYTPWGVFLRYEDDVVALLPRTAGTAVERLPAEAAFVKYGVIVGRFWGPAYHDHPSDLRDSEMPVPSEQDLLDAAAALAEAQRVHDACYGWDVRVVSGAAKGRLLGNGSRGIGEPVGADCERSVVLKGTIDPLAGRYARRGDPGDWSFRVSYRLDGEFPQASFEALSIPFVELIEGSTTEPSDGGAIAGKGLLEYIGALPLLAQEADALDTVPLPAPQRPAEAIAPVERSDAERRAEKAGWGIFAVLLRVGAGFALVILAGGLLAGLVAWLIRARRGPASRAGR